MKVTFRRKKSLTNDSNDLRLQSKLIAESCGNITDSTSPVIYDVRHFSNMVVHVPAGKQQHGDKGQCSPQISVIDNWRKEWVSDPANCGDGNDRRNERDKA